MMILWVTLYNHINVPFLIKWWTHLIIHWYLWGFMVTCDTSYNPPLSVVTLICKLFSSFRVTDFCVPYKPLKFLNYFFFAIWPHASHFSRGKFPMFNCKRDLEFSIWVTGVCSWPWAVTAPGTFQRIDRDITLYLYKIMAIYILLIYNILLYLYLLTYIYI